MNIYIYTLQDTTSYPKYFFILLCFDRFFIILVSFSTLSIQLKNSGKATLIMIEIEIKLFFYKNYK